ncbi:MAG: ABC transporter ATP-binding protein [Candidatus Saganbacteria bacterium]|nr:ABC transporter ATP-binding protein [Candidatus Saganbacteria bacterium]
MNKPIISINNLSKRYLLGLGGGEQYRALRDVIVNSLMSLFRRKYRQNSFEEIWALKDVSFDVEKGQKIAIIGRNGAGKSTLLKILSRITCPTEGEVKIRGRVASLLEVGTGFHPELTGRENIFMNGAILGMTRAEIKRKFDEIVAFSEIEKFIDTPVKRYSSGMSVRLAFSVAAHLEPEILVIDEVLAVGDLMFQKKCMGKMDNVAKQGRTVLFVSHNMEAVRRLCPRAVLLKDGMIVKDGPTSEVVRKYMEVGVEEQGEKIWNSIEDAPGDDVVRMHAVRVLNKNGKVCTKFDVCDEIMLEMEYWVLKDDHPLDATYYLIDERGHTILVTLDNLDSPWNEKKKPVGHYCSRCKVPGNLLNNGQISLLAAVVTHPHPVHVILRDVLRFDVGDAMNPNGVRGNHAMPWPPSAVRPRLQWSEEFVPLDNN